jgi:hypothetical protein
LAWNELIFQEELVPNSNLCSLSSSGKDFPSQVSLLVIRKIGNSIASYAWGLGKVSNNVAEAYALYEGVCIAKEQMSLKSWFLGTH